VIRLGDDGVAPGLDLSYLRSLVNSTRSKTVERCNLADSTGWGSLLGDDVAVLLAWEVIDEMVVLPVGLLASRGGARGRRGLWFVSR